MIKKLSYALVGVLAAFLLCGNATAAKINIDVNNTMKPGGSEEAAIKKFKEIVEKKSEGRMNVKMFMSGQLGSEEAVLELLKIGQTQMSLTGGVFRGMYAKEYDPISIPFYLPTWKSVEAYLKGPMGDKIRELSAEKGGIIDMGPQKRAPRETTSNRKFVEPEDIKGLKFRLPAVSIWVNVWKELGALPVVIPAPEIYLAMKTGQVDGHENTLASPYSRKLWEVQKYIIMTDHIFFPWHWVASKTWFAKLDPKDQQIIRDAVEEARIYGAKIEDEMDVFYITELKKHGMEFITPNLVAIRQKAMPAIKEAIKALAPGVAEEVERVSK
ncbi:MAG: TRAP transporter substrate-binding protein [Verrucomicrobia bacterium]|nr:TRAP transporter substrate-binding protein [Verrucomicrobiota bacterium]